MNRKYSLNLFMQLGAANAAVLGVMAGVLAYLADLVGVRLPIYASLTVLPFAEALLFLVLVPIIAALVGATLGALGYLIVTVARRLGNLPKQGFNMRMKPG